ncbi:Fur family transcriptional regulator [Persicirhabdus sediminis]|uniref:Transcriptional repressor n=1 Tax=Persicirhabdus sediminis TaxID=454144 RepID=A0A8J7MFY2_9BACT|nr:transcriptional repressor [Persicirhabdus sediminis]MBK1792110.1 transcriptional repressor [Persicirhabdus sediminis]
MSTQLTEALDRCRAAGMRKTQALEKLLSVLTAAQRPMTLAECAESPELADQCDNATVFRLLQRLNNHDIVRRMGLHERAAYFELVIPGRHKDYLICTECGNIQPINAPCPVHELEKEIRFTTGYKGLYHKLEFYGTCPDCEQKPSH